MLRGHRCELELRKQAAADYHAGCFLRADVEEWYNGSIDTLRTRESS